MGSKMALFNFLPPPKKKLSGATLGLERLPETKRENEEDRGMRFLICLQYIHIFFFYIL